MKPFLKPFRVNLFKAGVTLLCCAGSLTYAVLVHAADDQPAAPTAVPAAQVQVLILPKIVIGGLRSGQTMLITDRDIEIVKPEQMAQKMTPKPPAFPDFCMIR
jgi:hypothetical protein